MGRTAQRGHGACAVHPWVFFVDADERATPELAAEVRQVIAERRVCAGYWVPRRNYIFGKLMRHTGWSPDYQPRLLNAARCRWDPAHPVHELVIFDGPDGHLTQHTHPLQLRQPGPVRAKQERYTDHRCPPVAQSRASAPACARSSASPCASSSAVSSRLQGYRDGLLRPPAEHALSPTTRSALMSNCGVCSDERR